MSDPQLRTEPLGGSPLARLATEGGAPEAWYPPVPRGADGWRARAAAVRADFTGDGWLRSLAPAFAATGRAATRLDRAADRGVLVTTGQQPGLFGGPIYAWSKALSALALADAIEQATGIPTAPVFWAASDDADFAEASETRVALPGRAERLRMAPTAPEGTPMASVPLGGDVEPLLRVLERGAGSVPNEAPMEAARRAYRPGETVGGAYCTLLRELFEPYGIAVLDASHPATRSAASPLLRNALARAALVEERLVARAREIVDRGLTPQVALVEGLSLVFASGAAGKKRVSIPDATAAAGRADAEELSPNVLLRPVVERALLPTVGYMAGPGELAYFAQVTAVAEAIGAAVPLALPRWSGTIVEPHVTDILRRLSIDEAELADPHRVETRLAREAAPSTLTAALADARAAVDALARTLHGSPETQSLVPEPAVEGARRSLLHRLERLERRYLAAVKRRQHAVLQDVGTARASLYPDGVRQERALNFLPFLARYGEPLVQRMREAAGEHVARVAHLAGAAERPADRAAARV